MRSIQVLLFLSSMALASVHMFAEVCKTTPRAAVAALHLLPTEANALARSQAGYRVRGVHWDATLGIGWALLEECAHPERPWTAVRVRGAENLHMHAVHGVGSAAMPRPIAALPMLKPAVHAGDSVRLWQSGEWVRIELAAVAEQSGKVGDDIWLRVHRAGTLQQMRGIVRAPGSVEMLP
ncbi:MAG: flagella basal body P-ring formation protein FlgA [Acidobacteriaceae bacterium]